MKLGLAPIWCRAGLTAGWCNSSSSAHPSRSARTHCLTSLTLWCRESGLSYNLIVYHLRVSLNLLEFSVTCRDDSSLHSRKMMNLCRGTLRKIYNHNLLSEFPRPSRSYILFGEHCWISLIFCRVLSKCIADGIWVVWSSLPNFGQKSTVGWAVYI